MRKIISLMLIIASCFVLVGCNSTNNSDKINQNETTENTEEKTNSAESKEDTKKQTILKQGEEATIKTDYGSYKVKVVSVNFMPKTDYRNSVVQFVYEYDNIDFKTGNNINGLLLQPTDFKLTDENGYVLSTMDRGWKDEMQEAKILMPGEKCVAKMTYKINSEDIKKVKITMDRLNQMSTYYEIDVTR